MQERRQEQRDLQAVLGGRAEEAQGPVDLEDIAVAHAPLDPVEQAVKLEPAKELAIPRGPLVADLGLDQHRAQQDGLRQPDVIAVDQPLGRHVVERQQPVLVAQVGEERGRDGVGLEVQLAGHGAQDLVAAKDLAVARAGPARSHLAAIVGRRREDLLADHVGRDVGHHLELGAILEHLGQPAIHLRRLAAAAEKLVDLAFDLAPRHPGPLAEEEQQALGRLEPARGLAVDVERDHPLLRDLDSDQVTSEHR